MIRALPIFFTILLSVDPVLAGSFRTTATYYSNYYVGRKMANGQRFSQNSNAVAHPYLPLGTQVKITHTRCVKYGRKCSYKKFTVTGVVKDRCRCTLDLSKGLFTQLAPLKKGRISVKVSY